MAQGARGWLVSLMMLAAGFVAGTLLASRPDAPAEEDPLLEIPPVVSVDCEEAVITVVDDPHPGLQTAPDEAGLRAALARLPAPEVPAGAGVITGRASTVDGAPLAGVLVTAMPQMPDELRTRSAPGREPALEEVVRRTVAQHRWREAAARRATTGADGTFRLEGLADLEHRVVPAHPDHELQRGPRNARNARPGADLAYVFLAQARVTVDLLLPDGSRPEQGQVNFASATGTGHHHGWQPQRREFTLPPGTYSATATAGEDGLWTSEPQTVTLEVGAPALLQFALRGRPGIRGRLLQAPGEHWERCEVRIARIAPDMRPDPALLAPDRGLRDRRGRVRGDRYAFPDLAPGRYLVGAARTGNGSVVVTQEVDVGAEAVEQDLRMPPLRAEEYVVVRAIGPYGAALRDVRVNTGYVHESSSSSGGGDHILRPDGSLWVLHHLAGVGTSPDGTWWVEVTSSTYGTRRRAYDRAKERSIVLRFDDPASLRVRVAGVQGSRYEGRVHVSLLEDGGTGGGGRRAFGHRGAYALDSGGGLLVPDLQPGRYRILLRIDDRHSGFPVDETTATLASGENEVRLALPALYAVTFEGVQGTVFVRGNETPPVGQTFGRAGADGRVVLDGLPAGRYVAQTGSTQREFTLPGPSTLDLR